MEMLDKEKIMLIEDFLTSIKGKEFLYDGMGEEYVDVNWNIAEAFIKTLGYKEFDKYNLYSFFEEMDSIGDLFDYQIDDEQSSIDDFLEIEDADYLLTAAFLQKITDEIDDIDSKVKNITSISKKTKNKILERANYLAEKIQTTYEYTEDEKSDLERIGQIISEVRGFNFPVDIEQGVNTFDSEVCFFGLLGGEASGGYYVEEHGIWSYDLKKYEKLEKAYPSIARAILNIVDPPCTDGGEYNVYEYPLCYKDRLVQAYILSGDDISDPAEVMHPMYLVALWAAVSAVAQGYA